MKIKKYLGETAHEAMSKLKMELGPDAVILNTKTIRVKGFFGFLKRPLVEITAAYEDKDLLQKKTIGNYESKLNNISEDIVELKKTIRELSVEKKENSFSSPILQNYYNRMINNGISPKISYDFLKEIEEDIKFEDKDINTIEKIIEFSLLESLGEPKPIIFNKNNNKIYFIGPTGVGKTTTLAKIAAKLVLEGKYDIGLITADTYRIGAVEQLKIYSEILQLPLEIAYNKDDMIKAFNKFKDKDYILIDTAGRSHNDMVQMEELKELLDLTNNKETFLLINANIDYRGLEKLIEKYSFVEDYKLIITKTDETENYGNILNIKKAANKELSYITNGQNVPDDIEFIEVNSIIKKLIEENYND